MTILAFLYLPISLAGTIFGMNVQQINDTGPSIWIFLATTVILVVCIIPLLMLSAAVASLRRRRVAALKPLSEGEHGVRGRIPRYGFLLLDTMLFVERPEWLTWKAFYLELKEDWKHRHDRTSDRQARLEVAMARAAEDLRRQESVSS